MGKALIYTRVSDTRQIDNTSLEGQQDACRDWYLRNDLEVSRVFVERGESAKSSDRPQFQAMFKHLRMATKGSISHVVIYKFDTFSRHVEDGGAYRMELRNLGVLLRSTTEATDESPAGKFLTTMLAAAGQFDNDNRSERAVSGMKIRFASGRWVWRAPTGYLKGSKSGASLVPDPVRASMITKLFDLVASGEHTQVTALASVTALGLRSPTGAALTKETVRKILINHLYTGEMIVEGWGEPVKGDFIPLVSEETFNRVQGFLAGRAPAYVPHLTQRPDFPLRRFLLCNDCGKLVTASLSTGKVGKMLGYYRCAHVRGHMNVRVEVVEKAFVDLLNRLTPKAEQMANIDRIFRNAWKQRKQRQLKNTPLSDGSLRTNRGASSEPSTIGLTATSARKTSSP